MKYDMYVFSGSGNTKLIANEYKKHFEKANIQSEIKDIELPLSFNSDNAQMIGIFYPIHGFNAPKIILDFAKQLPKATTQQKVFIVKTSGEPLLLNNASSLKLISILKKKNYTVCNEYSYCMPYNMIFRHDEGFAAKMYNTAKQLVVVDCAEIVNSTPHHLKKCPLGRLLSFIIRIEHPAMRVNGKLFKINKDKCVNCLKCVNNCPTKNIKFENGKFTFANNCLMCTRCSFNCPTNAFSIGILNGWKVNGQYKFDVEEGEQTSSHKNYCKKSYQKYFKNAQKRINEYKFDSNCATIE